MDDFIRALGGDLDGLRSLVSLARRHNSMDNLRWLLEILWRERTPAVSLASPCVIQAVDETHRWWEPPHAVGKDYHAIPKERDGLTIDQSHPNWGRGSWGTPCHRGLYLHQWGGPFKLSDLAGGWVCKVCLRKTAREHITPRPLKLQEIEELQQAAGKEVFEVRRAFREELLLRPYLEMIHFPAKKEG